MQIRCGLWSRFSGPQLKANFSLHKDLLCPWCLMSIREGKGAQLLIQHSTEMDWEYLWRNLIKSRLTKLMNRHGMFHTKITRQQNKWYLLTEFQHVVDRMCRKHLDISLKLFTYSGPRQRRNLTVHSRGSSYSQIATDQWVSLHLGNSVTRLLNTLSKDA